jgi:hypothetical protein
MCLTRVDINLNVGGFALSPLFFSAEKIILIKLLAQAIDLDGKQSEQDFPFSSMEKLIRIFDYEPRCDGRKLNFLRISPVFV